MDVSERLRAALADRYALVRRIGSGGMALLLAGDPPERHLGGGPGERPLKLRSPLRILAGREYP